MSRIDTLMRKTKEGTRKRKRKEAEEAIERSNTIQLAIDEGVELVWKGMYSIGDQGKTRYIVNVWTLNEESNIFKCLNGDDWRHIAKKIAKEISSLYDIVTRVDGCSIQLDWSALCDSNDSIEEFSEDL